MKRIRAAAEARHIGMRVLRREPRIILLIALAVATVASMLFT
jgi:hypothetical protein